MCVCVCVCVCVYVCMCACVCVCVCAHLESDFRVDRVEVSQFVPKDRDPFMILSAP